MKQKKLSPIISIIITLMMSSCGMVTSMYQVIELSSKETKLEKDSYVFENSELKIAYNFWTSGGKVSFFITNKLDIPIYIDWDKSHLIYNGISYDYWYDTEETNSFYSSSFSSASNTVSGAMVNYFANSAYRNSQSSTASYGNAVTVVESSKTKPKKIIQIPPKSSVAVSKFSISNPKTPFYSCDFNLKNTGYKTPSTNKFVKEESPLSFRNYITYTTTENSIEKKSIDNEFFISEISFMTEELFFGKTITKKECDIDGKERVDSLSYSKPYKKPNAFYIKVKQKEFRPY
ncbi:MAG: hypothetical protein NTX03_02295 [Bacteroidetes bacterium]|nr:hypothetical protein [Bacteroidota bacterium]